MYRHSEVFRTMLVVADAALVAAAWLASFWLRFDSGLFPTPLGVPPVQQYLYPLALIVPLWPAANVAVTHVGGLVNT